MKHYIITRFSINLKEGFQKKNIKLFDKNRLELRFLIFETFCLPSVKGQTSQNFDWIILIDKELPSKYVKRLQNLVGNQQNIHLVTYTGFNLGTLDFIENALGKIKSEYVITTRLDDDDALCSNFIETVQQEYKQMKTKNLLFLSYPKGLHWKPEKSKRLGGFYVTLRPCIALGLSLIVVKNKYPFSVLFRNHTKIIETLEEDRNNPKSKLSKYAKKCGDTISKWNMNSKLKIIKTKKEMYIRTVHGDNDAAKLSSTKLFKKIKKDINLKRFSLDAKMIKKANQILNI